MIPTRHQHRRFGDAPLRWFARGRFQPGLDRLVQLCISQPILNEYEEVLHRPRLKIHTGRVTTALARIREDGLLVTPTMPVTAATDPDDNIFLECAAAAEAQYLVTGNQAPSPLKFGERLGL